MGGYVAQAITLQRPDLIRRLIIAASGPGATPDTPPSPAKSQQVAGKPVNDDEDFLYLFFPETARDAGLASLRRLNTRLQQSHASVSAESVGAQSRALGRWAKGDGTSWDKLDQLTLPTLVANGAHDVMIHTYGSYAMSQRLPNAKIILYSDSGHGFLFQHIDDFSDEVGHFLK